MDKFAVKLPTVGLHLKLAHSNFCGHPRALKKLVPAELWYALSVRYHHWGQLCLCSKSCRFFQNLNFWSTIADGPGDILFTGHSTTGQRKQSLHSSALLPLAPDERHLHRLRVALLDFMKRLAMLVSLGWNKRQRKRQRQRSCREQRTLLFESFDIVFRLGVLAFKVLCFWEPTILPVQGTHFMTWKRDPSY